MMLRWSIGWATLMMLTGCPDEESRDTCPAVAGIEFESEAAQRDAEETRFFCIFEEEKRQDPWATEREADWDACLREEPMGDWEPTMDPSQVDIECRETLCRVAVRAGQWSTPCTPVGTASYYLTEVDGTSGQVIYFSDHDGLPWSYLGYDD